MNKIRLSYTLLSLWERGDIDGAISTYFHLDRPVTRQMKEGKELHKQIEKHINEMNSLPEWFFSYPLVTPEPERELIVSYNDMFNLKCYIDCLDEPQKLFFEWKTGVTDSSTWARTNQIPLYFLICEIAGIDVDKAILVRWDQYNKQSDFSIVHNSKVVRNKARNMIDSTGPDIHTYFVNEGLI